MLNMDRNINNNNNNIIIIINLLRALFKQQNFFSIILAKIMLKKFCCLEFSFWVSFLAESEHSSTPTPVMSHQ